MSTSLLTDSLFRVRTRDDNDAELSLPAILDALYRDEVVSFEALQAHQEQAWYTFLVQLGAMAVVRANNGRVPESEKGWHDALLVLADGNEYAWHLVVDDPDEPAFMQPPVRPSVSPGALDDAKYKNDVPTPSNLDVLVTSKNHDVKQQRITNPRPEHWVYALVTLQTMEGFLGRGNYGIVRMNGGFGNRPFLGFSPSLSFGGRFWRDLNVLVDQHDNLDTLYDVTSGHTLIWTIPWDGAKESAVHLKNCDPYFIEICRRIRFTREGDRIVCWRANSKGQRIDAPSSLNGRTEDPWTPVDDEKALTLGESGFTYRKLQQIVFQDEYVRPVALQPHETDDGAMYLTARAMVRGQGKTEGLHHRIIPVPQKVYGLFPDQDAMDVLARRAKQRVKLASTVESQVLRPAVAALLSGGRDSQVDWEQVQPWIDAFDDTVDDQFFDRLWASVGMGAEEAERSWQTFLKNEAQRQFENAQDGVPMPDVRRWRALSAAQSVFRSRLHDTLQKALSTSTASSSTTA